MRKAAFFDVDGTITTGRVWRGIMDYFKVRGQRRVTNALFWAYNTPSYLLFKARLISQSAFRRRWASSLPWYFRGYSLEKADQIWTYVVRDYLKDLWRPDALELIRQHKADGDLVVLVSAGPTPLTSCIAKEVGAEFAIGTLPEQRDGHYTGRIAGPVCMEEFKARLTVDELRRRKIEVNLPESFAYADSSGDVDLLEMVGHPVAMYPDKHLRPIAIERGWRVIGEADED